MLLRRYYGTCPRSWQLFGHAKMLARTFSSSNTPERSGSQVCVMGKGYIGAMGMPHHRDILEPEVVPRLQDMNIISASAGWGHSAFVDEDGLLYVCGRTHDYRNTIRHIRSYQGIQAMVHSWNFVNKYIVRMEFEPLLVSPVNNTTTGADANEEGNTEDIVFTKTVCSPGDLTAALTDDGRIFTLGANMHGQLGAGKISTSEYDLQEVEPAIRSATAEHSEDYEMDAFVDLSLGFQFGVALTEAGKLWSWGKGGRGQLGQADNETYKAPVEITGKQGELEGTIWTDVSCGFSHAAAVTSDGAGFVWGRMRSVEPIPGRGERFAYDQWFPRHVELPSGVELESVACGQSHTAFLDTENTIWMLGFRGRGIQYDTTPVNPNEDMDNFDIDSSLMSEQDYLSQPVPVKRKPWEQYGLHVVKIRAGIHHTYAICDDGSVWRWGWRRTPEPVIPFVRGGFQAHDLRAGFNHMVAIGRFGEHNELSERTSAKVEPDNMERFFTT
eukprot:gb/GECG01006919.1/.p1 GENE.gb/GECG01006919.1/~~gb/GECG01006919.1/.p1  ORF type:complete len:498 (+),score=54.39 gb/GECG01006919.1/:1-1494(+)